MSRIRHLGILFVLVAISVTALAKDFEVASVKRSKGPAPGEPPGRFRQSGQQVIFESYPMQGLLIFAFGRRPHELEMPAWMRDEHYDISANMPPDATRADLSELLLNLLKQRFGLTFHHEMKAKPVYILTATKNLNLQPVPTSAERTHTTSYGNNTWRVEFTERMEMLAALLPPIDKPIVDKTGLTGYFSGVLEIHVVRPDAPPGGPTPVDAVADAFEKLGLKLEPRSLPIDVVVIDHAEKLPSEN